MKDLLLRDIDLQRFSEADEANANSASESQTEANEQEKDAEIISYSEEELQEAINKAVAEATKGMLSKDKVNEIVKKEKAKEAERAKMTAEELAEEERRETQEKLAAAQEEIRVMKLSNETSKLLDEKEIPQHFAEFLMKDDLETTKANVDKFKKTYEEDIKKAVKEALKTDTPKAGNEAEPLSVWEAAANKIR